MNTTELVIQVTKIVLGIAIGIYIVFIGGKIYNEIKSDPLDVNRDGVVDIVDWSIFDASFITSGSTIE